MENRDRFNKCVDEFNINYGKDPERTVEVMENAVNELNHVKKEDKYDKKVGFSDANFDLLMAVVLGVFGALLGFVNFSEMMGLWFFGYIFFIAGYFVGITAKGMGIVFLFSHGMTGLALMNGSVLGPLLQSPMMQDNPQNVYYYIGFAIALYVVATFYTVIVNLSDNMKKKEHINIIPLSIYTVGLTLMAILPHIVDKIYTFHI